MNALKTKVNLASSFLVLGLLLTACLTAPKPSAATVNGVIGIDRTKGSA